VLLGLRICHGIARAADTLGEYRFVLLCMLDLFGAVQGAVSFKILPLSFSSSRYLWNSPGVAFDSDQHGLRDLAGNRDHVLLDFPIYQQGPLDIKLGLGVACMVHRCNKHKNRASNLDRGK
jgi:hypothetical protein